MKRAFVASVALLAVPSVAYWSDSANGQEDPFADTFSQAATAAADKATPPPAEANLQKMRAELVALAKTRAEMMNEAELAEAIAAAKVENSQLQAKRDLERAQALLNEIAEKHPETPAGKSARKALQAIRQLEPIDENFTAPPYDPFEGAAEPEFERPAASKAEPFGDPAGPFESVGEARKK